MVSGSKSLDVNHNRNRLRDVGVVHGRGRGRLYRDRLPHTDHLSGEWIVQANPAKLLA